MELGPVAVLFSLAFWGALWGVSGAILSVPLTAACRIFVLHHWNERRAVGGGSGALGIGKAGHTAEMGAVGGGEQQGEHEE